MIPTRRYSLCNTNIQRLMRTDFYQKTGRQVGNDQDKAQSKEIPTPNTEAGKNQINQKSTWPKRTSITLLASIVLPLDILCVKYVHHAGTFLSFMCS